MPVTQRPVAPQPQVRWSHDPMADLRARNAAASDAGRARVLAAADADRNRLFDQGQQEHTTRMQQLEYDQARGIGVPPPASAPQRVSASSESADDGPPPPPQPIDYQALRQLAQVATPPPVAAPNPEEDRRISEQAFARAKDNAGLLALRRSADARSGALRMGQTGGGAELSAQNAILDDTVDNLTGVTTAQAEQEAARRYGVADRNYAGAIQQRGQDISLRPSLLSLYSQSQRRY